MKKGEPVAYAGWSRTRDLNPQNLMLTKQLLYH